MSGTDLFIGLMSGTSADAVDAALVSFDDTSGVNTLASHSLPMPESLRKRIVALQTRASRDIFDVCELDVELADLYAAAVSELLAKTEYEATDITAVGNHGQTLLHFPNHERAFTLQVGDNHRLAELSGITVVGDFRRRDVAAGGQAAPLIPAFHRTLVSSSESAVFLNIGGIANISCIAKGRVSGFDTGPGNTLMDAWINRHKGVNFDRDGAWAREGSVNAQLLSAMREDPYFRKSAPKSTGQDYFNLAWLDQFLMADIALEDVQRTLLELTATTASEAISLNGCSSVFTFGGGRHNTLLMERLQTLLGDVSVEPTDRLGIDPDYMEATAFAWLAKQCLAGQAGNEPKVTGARGDRVLGVIFPA